MQVFCKPLTSVHGGTPAAGSPSTPSGLSLGDITAIVLAVIAVLVMLIGGAILLHRRRHARACEPVSDQDFKVLPLDTPMTQVRHIFSNCTASPHINS